MISFKILSRIYVKIPVLSIVNRKLTTKINNQTINYIKEGTGDQTLFLCPGGLGTIWSDFKPQIEQLDRNKFTIIAWDPPGYGKSRPPNRKFDIDFYEQDADCAHNLLKSIGVEKYYLLGWSDGGITSLIMSAKYPKNIEKLVIWGANSYLKSQDIQLYENIKDINQWSDSMKTPLIELYTEKGLQKLWNDWFNIMVKIHKNGGDICSSKLKEIKCPTLILHGDKDPLVPEEHPVYLLENIKNAKKIHRFPKGKHNIHLKYAEEFNKIITEFILTPEHVN